MKTEKQMLGRIEVSVRIDPEIKIEIKQGLGRIKRRMVGIFNARRSWEKQSVYELDNGWVATLEYSTHYGEMVSRLDAPKGHLLDNGKPYWHCSDGLAHLPDFAQGWREVVVKSAGTELVRPGFEKKFRPQTIEQRVVDRIATKIRMLGQSEGVGHSLHSEGD